NALVDGNVFDHAQIRIPIRLGEENVAACAVVARSGNCECADAIEHYRSERARSVVIIHRRLRSHDVGARRVGEIRGADSAGNTERLTALEGVKTGQAPSADYPVDQTIRRPRE